jgi:hypothetical protein
MNQDQASPLATKDPLEENNVVSSPVNQNESFPSPIHQVEVIDPPRKKKLGKKAAQAAAMAGPVDYTDPFRGNQSSIARDAAGAEADAMSRPGVSQRATSGDYFNQKYFWMNVGRVTEGDRIKSHFGFNPFAEDTDFEKIRKDNQGTIMSGLNMMSAYGAKSTVHTIGGVTGFFVSGALAAGQGIVNAFIDDEKETTQGTALFVDNAYMRKVDEVAEGVDKGFSVFTSESDKKKGAFGFLSLKETAKSVSDALSFTTGAIASEALYSTLPGVGTAAGAAVIASRIGRTATKAARAVGVNSKLSKYGETAKIVFDRLNDFHNTPEAITRAERALNSSGKTIENVASLIQNARKFSAFTRGVGVGLRTTHYEASMEARQAKDTMISNGEAIIDEELRKMEDGPEKEKKRKELSEENILRAEKFALGVYGVNAALLSASNFVQFPSIFGPRKIVSNTAMRAENELADHLMYNAKRELVEKGSSKLAKTARVAGAVAKPFTEALEEISQGLTANTAIDYHDRRFRARASGNKMIEQTVDFADSMKNALEEDYLEEATIGLIVGMIGGPSIKRNANKKIKPVLHNEMFNDIKSAVSSTSPEQRAMLEEAIRFANTSSKEGTFEAMKYGYETSKEGVLMKEAEDKLDDEGNQAGLETLRQDKIFQNAKSFIEKGMDFAIDEQIKDAKEMSLETFRQKMSDDSITQEQKDDVVKNFEEKTGIYRKAYAKVYKGMSMDKLKDNQTNKDLLATLVYSMSNFEAQDKRIKEAMSGVKEISTLGEDKMNELLDLHSEFDSITKDELSALKKENTKEFDEAKENLNKGIVGSRSARKASRIRAAAQKKSSQKRKDNDEKIAKLEEIFEEEKVADGAEQTGKIGLVSLEINAAKRKAAERGISTIASKKNGLSRLFSGKQQRLLTTKDLERYGALMNEFLDGLNNAETSSNSPRSISDVRKFFSSDIEKSKIKAKLDEAAHVFEERRKALDILTYLYGINKYADTYKIMQAANLNELNSMLREEIREASRIHIVKAAQKDKLTKDEQNMYDTKLASLIASIEVNKNALAKELDDKEEMENITEESLIHMKQTIDDAEGVIKTYQDMKSHEEAQEVVALSEVITEGKKEVTAEEEMESDPLSISKQELEEAKTAFSFGVPEREEKGSFQMIARSSEEDKPDKNNEIADALNNGDIKIKNITYFTSRTEDFSLTKDQLDLITPEQAALYEAGRKAILEGKGEVLKNKDLSKIMFKEDGVTFENDLTKNPLAHIQFFLMTYSLEMEVSNDTFEGDEIKRKSPEERFSITGKYLYSPYEVFGKNSPKNINAYKERVAEAEEELINVKNFIENKGPEMTEQQMNVAKNKLIATEIKLSALKARKNDEAMLNARIDYVFDKILNENLSGVENQVFRKPVQINSVYAGEVIRNLDENGNKQVNQINNHPLTKPVIEVDGAFTNTDETLSGSDTAVDMFENGELLLCVGGSHYGNVRMLNMKTGEEKEVSVKDDKNWGNYSIGALYYKHENSFGGFRNVKLFNSNIAEAANGKLLSQIQKYIEIAIDKMIEKNSVGEESKILIDNEEVQIEEGDFFGMFDHLEDRKIKIHDLMLHFLPVQKSFRSDEGTVARRMYLFNASEYAEGEGLVKMKKTLEQTEDFSPDDLDAATVGKFADEKAAREDEAKKKKASKKEKADTLKEKKPVNRVMAFPGTIDFSFGEISEDENRKAELISVISEQIGQMRFSFNMDQYLDKKKEKDSKERTVKNNDAFNILFSTGLISHPFRPSIQRDSIYEKTEKVTKFNADGSVEVVKEQSAPYQITYEIKGRTAKAKNIYTSFKKAIDFFKKKQLPVRVRALFGIAPQGDLNKKEVVRGLLRDQFKGVIKEMTDTLLSVNSKSEEIAAKELSAELKALNKPNFSVKSDSLKNNSYNINVKSAYKQTYEKTIKKLIPSIKKRVGLAIKGIEEEIKRIKTEEANIKGSPDALIKNLEEYIEVLKEIDVRLQKEMIYEGDNAVSYGIQQKFVGATILAEIMPVVLYKIATGSKNMIDYVGPIVNSLTASVVAKIDNSKVIDGESYEPWQLMNEVYSLDDLDMANAIDLSEDKEGDVAEETSGRTIDVEKEFSEDLSEAERLIFNSDVDADSDNTSKLISEAKAKHDELMFADGDLADAANGESSFGRGRKALGSNPVFSEEIDKVLNETEVEKLFGQINNVMNVSIFNKKIDAIEKIIKSRIASVYTAEKGKSEDVENALKRGAARAYAKTVIYVALQQKILEMQQEKLTEEEEIEVVEEPVIEQPDVEVEPIQTAPETQPQAEVKEQEEVKKVETQPQEVVSEVTEDNQIEGEIVPGTEEEVVSSEKDAETIVEEPTKEEPKLKKSVVPLKKRRSASSINSASTDSAKKNEVVQEKLNEEKPETVVEDNKTEEIKIPVKMKLNIAKYLNAANIVNNSAKSEDEYIKLKDEYKDISRFVKSESARRNIHKGMFSYVKDGVLKEYITFDALEKDNNCNA